MSKSNGGGRTGYLLFVWSPTGYTLRERDGDPPQPGQELEEDGRALLVTKLGASPLPGDPRRCAFTVGRS
jgi:hypothetical protein